MDRNFVVQKVKVLLEEISPFEEPSSFIAAAGDTTYDKVKPIISYINESINDATHFCLNNLPLSLLSRDIDKGEYAAKLYALTNHHKGNMYYVEDFDKYRRLVRVESPKWKRACTEFYTSSDPIYLLQENEYTQGGPCKPAVVYVPEISRLELYTIESTNSTESVNIWCVRTDKPVEGVISLIADFIAIKCAEIVFNIFDNSNGATRMQNEWQAKLANTLK